MNITKHWHDGFDIITDMVSLHDKDFKIVRANKAFLAAFHKTQDSVCGILCYQLVHKTDAPIYNCPLKHSLESGVTTAEEIYEPSLGLYLEVTCYPVFDDKGDFEGVVHFVKDITERKKAADTLRRSEENSLEQSEINYRLLLENIPQKIFLKDRNSVYISCNDNYARDLKINSSEISGMTDYDFYPKELAAKYRADDKRVMEKGEREDIEEKYIQNGNEYFVHTVKTPVRDRQGKVFGILGIFTDITERKRAEELLIESEQRFRRLIENAPFAIGVIARNGTIEYVNKNHLEIFGYDTADCPTLNHWWSIAYPDETIRKKVISDWNNTLERIFDRDENIQIERRITCKDGKVKDIELRIMALEGRVITVFDDITKRKQAEEELSTRARQQAVVAEFGQYALNVRDLQALMDHAVTIVAQTLGVEYSKILELLSDRQNLLLRAGVGWNEGLVGHATVSTGLDSQAGYTLASSEAVIVEDLRSEKRFNGPPLLFEHGVISGISVIIQGKDGPWGVMGAHSARQIPFTNDDIHFFQAVANILAEALERNQAEEALREANEELEKRVQARTAELKKNLNFLSLLIDTIPSPVFYKNFQGVYTGCNKAFEDFVGRTKNDIVGHTVYDIAPRELADIYYNADMELMQGKGYQVYETKFLRADGAERDIITYKSFFKEQDSEVGVIVGIFLDITERKQMEGKLRDYSFELERSNKDLESFASIASHDLQEPLRGISGFAQLLKKRYTGKLDKDADEFVSYIVDGADRMQQLIKDLLEYSRVSSRSNPFKPTDFNSVVSRALANLKMAVEDNSAGITCEELPTIAADESQMVSLMQNLIGNAVKYHGNEPPLVRVSAYKEGTEWVFSVADNGIGIDPKYNERIFRIFQRLHKRDTYSGTGVGLAVCKRIVEKHGGSIWVSSEPGKGSVFYFTIPEK
ncbi:MAG: PAS domain S-box protein [Nitrospirae bacterium]|nr:PAS domain S-box protein [Nitrospirota bacterium]